ncbi:MAG: aldo/keto reductase [Actinobacteria bacterium]|nr:aldo/keto reductase [Actinomycetota bacterium]
MPRRRLGRTGFEVSEVGFGGWAIGGTWGAVDEGNALAAIRAALDEGVTFFDTADVYGDGLSERRLAAVLGERPRAGVVVATKAGRRLDPHVSDGYNRVNLERFVDRSLENLGVEAIDLLQLHCPPPDAYYRQEVFEAVDELVTAGKVLHYGVSVEKVEEALKAIEYPGVETIQIIFNMFRHRPAALLFREAAVRDVGLIVRVPLASGLLSGKMSTATRFASDDHRTFNRDGSAFDVGETFAGVDYADGLAAVEELRPLVPDGATMAQFAIRWILMSEAVSTVIPGAKTAGQAIANAHSALLPELDPATMAAVADIYRRLIAPSVHHRW